MPALTRSPQLCRGAAGRRCARAHRAAVRGGAEHAGHAGERARSSCACCATRCSRRRSAPTCCCRALGLGALLPTPGRAGSQRAGADDAPRPPRRALDAHDGALARSTATRFDPSCWPAARSKRRACATPTRRLGARRPRRCATSRSSPSTCAARAAACPRRCSRCTQTTRAAGAVRLRPGQLGGRAGLLAFVISGARAWVERGMRSHERGDARRRPRRALPPSLARAARSVLHASSKSARPFAARPACCRPPMRDRARACCAAGD